jgi:hypothetical protein
MISFTMEQLDRVAEHRPNGYKKLVLKYSKVVGDRVWMSAIDHQRIRNYYLHKTPIEPTMGDMAKNLFDSLARWARNGFPVATEKQINKRKMECLNCPYWDGKARNGLGKCMHQKCGCTMVKWWIATEKCPDGKW